MQCEQYRAMASATGGLASKRPRSCFDISHRVTAAGRSQIFDFTFQMLRGGNSFNCLFFLAAGRGGQRGQEKGFGA